MTYIDVTGALARMRGNKKLYCRMLKMFLDNKEFAAFEDAIAANDMEKAADMAHTLKGMTGNLSLSAIYDMSAELMTTLRTENVGAEKIEEYRATYAQTRTAVEETIRELES